MRIVNGSLFIVNRKISLFFLVFLLSIIYYLLSINPAYAQVTCYNSTSNPKRTDGLVTTPSISGKFGTQPQNYPNGACITNNAQAALPSFQLPTYDQLKNQYYDKAYFPSSIKPAPLSSLTAGQLSSYLAQPDSLLYVNGNLTIEGTIGGRGTAVIFVQGNLNIDNDFIYNAGSGGVVFVVQGDIYIYSTTNRIDAALIAGGNIYTASPNGSSCTNNSQVFTPSGTNIQPLVVNGSLVSVNPSSSQSIFFCRKLADNTVAAEQVNYQTKYPVVLQDLMSSTLNIPILNADYKIGTVQTGAPDCNTTPVCSGSCTTTNNTCALNAGTQTSCSYTTYNGASGCTKVPAPNQPCTLNCSSGQTCYNGSCCTPSCPNPVTIACGQTISNGCGGSCGTGTACAAGQTCNSGACYAQVTLALSQSVRQTFTSLGYSISWSSGNATSCNGSWTGAVATSGSASFSQSNPGTYSYTVTCSNPTSSISRTANVAVYTQTNYVYANQMTGPITTVHAYDGNWFLANWVDPSYGNGWSLTSWDGESIGWTYAYAPITGATYNVYMFSYSNYATCGGSGGAIIYSVNGGASIPTWWMPSSPSLTYLGQSTNALMFASSGNYGGCSDRHVIYARFDGVAGK